MSSAQAASIVDAGFTCSNSHLRAELERVEWLVRAATEVRETEVPAQPEHARQWRQRGVGGIVETVDTILTGTLLEPEARPELQSARERGEALRSRNAASARVAQARGVCLRLERLADYAALEPQDRDLLLLSMLPALDSRFSDLLGYLLPDHRGGWPTLELAERLLAVDGHARWRLRSRLGAQAPLRRHDLLRLPDGRQSDPPPAPRQPLQPDPRVLAFLLGDDAPDERIAAYVRVVGVGGDAGGPTLPPGRLAALIDLLEAQPVQGPGAIIHLAGPAGCGKKMLAATLAARQRRPLLVVERALLELATPGLPAIVLREAMMQRAAVYWDGLDDWMSGRSPPLQHAMRQALADYRPWLFSGGCDDWRHHCRLGRRPVVEVSVPTPDAAQLAACWRDATSVFKPIDPDLDLESFTATVRLPPAAIEAAGATAAALSRLREPRAPFVSRRMLLAAARQLHSGGLSALARRIRARPGWDDLVLPDSRRKALRDLCHHVRYRHKVMAQWGFDRTLMLGRGVSALFSGPPGTGKTMAAAVLATELGLDLYHVDLSQVVSKYIGETEKHLARLFDEAEANSAILFFDEADALFGKRTEVRDSHDRYANLETSYLLQRVDEYEGLVILASNLPRNMDEAFVRRLRFIVPFTVPDRTQRLAIWQRLLPARTPRSDDIDLERLADGIELSGGYLRNIAVSAAYLAAAEDVAVGMRHLSAATQREYAKVGRVFEDEELESIFRTERKQP
ncbi:AAA family ATPase [Lysobacter maris]|uniref:AAA family ATPase n=1 Tax=Marilutibacter maris TaxID=1605891 RepID=A0A508B3X7_9GAMM|nr:AAA family ATPase [Lysobacter maris]KAB8198672.1 AAA family ATPase [Lysobacter maris]